MLRAILIVLFIQTIFALHRQKRDDGSFLSNSGGPVASVGEEELTENLAGNGSGEEEESLEPCEIEETKKMGTVRLEKLFDLEPSPNLKVALSPNAAGSNNSQSFSFSLTKQFAKFNVKFSKSYTNIRDQEAAFDTFSYNFVNMLQLTLKRKSHYDASFDVTEFMDVPYDCLKAEMTGALPNLKEARPVGEGIKINRSCLALSWTALDVVPQVRKQTKCGCCYAMSTGDMIAAQFVIDKGNFSTRYDLSAQWLADCIQQPAGYRCKGGRPAQMLEKLMTFTKFNFIPLESCYPYRDKNGTCFISVDCPATPDIRIKWGKMVDISGPKEKDVMAALLRHGPVVAIVGVTQAWQFYNGTGIIRPRQCSLNQKHAVLVTGYDYTGCVPHYTIKNSWGTLWGGKGYIKIEAGKNTCNIAKSVVFTCTSKNCDLKDPFKYALSNPKHPDCKI